MSGDGEPRANKSVLYFVIRGLHVREQIKMQ